MGGLIEVILCIVLLPILLLMPRRKRRRRRNRAETKAYDLSHVDPHAARETLIDADDWRIDE